MNHEHEMNILGRCTVCNVPMLNPHRFSSVPILKAYDGATSFGPIRARLSRRLGSRKPAHVVKVDRTSPWGNPFRVGDMVLFPTPVPSGYDFNRPPQSVVAPYRMPKGTPAAVTDRYTIRKLDTLEDAFETYRQWVHAPAQTKLRKAIHRDLRGRDLGCWCKLSDAAPDPTPCHANELLLIANPFRWDTTE
jgi:hypothetical protein